MFAIKRTIYQIRKHLQIAKQNEFVNGNVYENLAFNFHLNYFYQTENNRLKIQAVS